MRFFLYGTLQPAADTAMARWLAARVVAAHAATMPGRLLAIPSKGGWFPALVKGGMRDTCRGTVVRLALRPRDLARLDRYEGREYRRCAARVRIAGGTLVTATVYRWQAPSPQRSSIIADGDFLGWLERTGRRSFAIQRGAA